MTTCELFADADAAYVFGALDPAEAAAFEAHLRVCPQCASAVDESRAMAALLDGVPESAYFPEPVPLPDTLLPSMARQAAREQRRRRWLTGGLMTAAAACLVAFAVAIWPTQHSGGNTGSHPAAQALSARIPTAVHATAALQAKAWGTEIDLTCRYDKSADPYAGLDYSLVVIDRSGAVHSGGSWWLVPDKVTHFSGGISLPINQIAKVQIRLPNGTTVLQLTR